MFGKRTLHSDKAGNKIVKNYDGSYSVENKQGSRVNKKDSEKFLKKYGYKTKKTKGKLFTQKKSIWG